MSRASRAARFFRTSGREASTRVQGALASLDKESRLVLTLLFVEGLTEEETAAALGITSRTVRRDWVKAKGWLLQDLKPSDAS